MELSFALVLLLDLFIVIYIIYCFIIENTI